MFISDKNFESWINNKKEEENSVDHIYLDLND